MAKSISHNNLLVYDSDYLQDCQTYTDTAAIVQQEWQGLIEMLKTLQDGGIGGEKVMQGNIADKITSFASTQMEGKTKNRLTDIANGINSDMKSYIEAIDIADSNLY